MTHAAFCTAKALRSDLAVLGYELNSNPLCVAQSGPARLDTLRFLASLIDYEGADHSTANESKLDKFFSSAGLPWPRRAGAHAAFMRAAIDLAASAKARRSVAPEMDFDVDAYGVFTPEDDVADLELASLIAHREQLFPTRRAPPTKRARAPLVRRDPNVTRTKQARKPPLPSEAKEKRASYTRNLLEQPPPTAKEMVRLARLRAEQAAQEALAAGIQVPESEEPPKTIVRTSSVPDVVDSSDFFDSPSMSKLVDTDEKSESVEGTTKNDVTNEMSSQNSGVKEDDESLKFKEEVVVVESKTTITQKPTLHKKESTIDIDGEDDKEPASEGSEDAEHDQDDEENQPVQDKQAAKATALRSEIEALAAEAEQALAAVREFESMAAPLLQANASAVEEEAAIYDAELDAELSESVMDAHEAQKRMLSELRMHVDIERTYSSLEKWSTASPREAPDLKYCRARADAALAFTNAIEAD